ncbi:MAG: class I SAM-dependent methyltransferase [Burkholderiaceae bacterium]
MDKPYSAACERNCGPILQRLREVLAARQSVLEIGSGTGQHAVYFGRWLPHLQWQPSDLPENQAGVLAWMRQEGLVNVLTPIVLDMQAPKWPPKHYDAVYTANTCHIMSWPQVENMFEGVGALLVPNGVFCIYGPFRYHGRFTSEGDARFDASLRTHAAHCAIRDFEEIEALAQEHQLVLEADHAMPANNRLLIFERVVR